MITKVEQYKSTCNLFDFLDNLGIKVSSDTWNVLVEDYGEFEPCHHCGEISEECYCNEDAPYYAEYDDEASFD